MAQSYRDAVIIENTELTEIFYKLKVSGGFDARPGQFYMLKAWSGNDPILGRPISVADVDSDGNLLFLIAAVGKGTKIIQQLREGDKLSLLGPLGNEFPIEEKYEKVALVGGAAGIAPLLFLAKNLSCKVDLYAGFRDKTYFLNEFEGHVDNIYISTEDGSEGYKGYIIDVLDTSEYDAIYTCGPLPMMKALLRKNTANVPIYVSMESRMACGIGTCLGCSFKTVNGMRRVCKDGPVFKGEEILL